MAYPDYEQSQDRGQPVELYKFTYGTGATSYYTYTDGETPVDLDGDTYEPLAGLTRPAIKSDGRAGPNEVEIRVPMNAEVADLFRAYPPGQVVTVIIRQGHMPNPDDPPAFLAGEQFPVVFTGRVLEARREDGVCTLNCSSSAASIRRAGLRRHYQWACPLPLYGAECGADKDAARTTLPAASVEATKIILDPGWGGTPSDYIGGLAEWDTPDGRQVRTILRVDSGNILVLSGPTTGLSAGQTVDVFLGCPHTVAGCETLHNNIKRYGGHPFIPTFNPINKNNHT